MRSEAVARKGVATADRTYDEPVGGGDRKGGKISARFLKALRVRSKETHRFVRPDLREPGKVYRRAHERRVAKKPGAIRIGAPPGMPDFDDITYRRHGNLYVQGYHTSGKLYAWCLCGEWTLIAPEEIRENTRDACRTCMDPNPLLTSAAERMERWRREQGE